MKALVVFQKGDAPQLIQNYPDPKPTQDNQVLMTVKAAAIKHLDKSQASGKHYSVKINESEGKIPGGDGVGILENGERVYALGDKMMAEKALVDKNRIIKIPDGLDDITAAALPNAIAGSAMAMLYRAKIKPGNTVLINGATSFTGKIAIQLAKFYGAEKVIATGRNLESLELLKKLGADVCISISQSDEWFTEAIKAAHIASPINIIIDYLWGHTAELILTALQGDGNYSTPIKYVSVGSISGESINLSSAILRSTDLCLCGSGIGSWTKEEMTNLIRNIIPEIFELAAKNKIEVETQSISAEDIDKIWSSDLSGGKRLVMTF